MSVYRRHFVSGGAYFFTLVTQERAAILVEPTARAILHDAFAECKRRWPFVIDAIVLLPDHLHTIWLLPSNDDQFPRRWGFIKKEFTKRWIASGGQEQMISSQRSVRRMRGVWQPRYWEHAIQDEDDLGRHRDYIHYNPVKHGLVKKPVDWPYSSFHRWAAQGAYDPGWGCASTDDKRFQFDDLRTTAVE